MKWRSTFKRIFDFFGAPEHKEVEKTEAPRGPQFRL